MDFSLDAPPYVTTQEDHKEQVTDDTSTLSLDSAINDNEFVGIVTQKIQKAETYFNDTLKLDERSQRNERFYLGQQFDPNEFYQWQLPYVDNIIYRDLETRLAIASGRIPDVVIVPPADDKESMEKTNSLQTTLEVKVSKEMAKPLLKDGLRNLHIYLRSAIKPRWDQNKGPDGDFTFDLVRPTRIGVDHTATIPHDGFTADNMEFIYEFIEEPLGLICAKFPNKREQLLAMHGYKLGTTRQMATKLKYIEVWFTWYDKEGKPIEGVAWIYQSLMLNKMKNPYYDWQGYDATTTNDKGIVETKKAYRNHFDRPRKPYIWITYNNLGKGPIDDTSSLEQAIPLQKIINKRGRQITEIADRAVPKLAVSGAYMTKEDARRMTNDPGESLWLDKVTDIRQAVLYIPAAPPSPILTADLQMNRAEVDSLFATHGTTRGENTGDESGVAKQVVREGDLTIGDDLADLTIDRPYYEMVNWATQLMRLFYDQPHKVRSMGKDNKVTTVTLHRDDILPDINVEVQADTVDKAQRRADAMNLMAAKAIDPMTLFEDLDEPNPKERTQRLMYFLQGEGPTGDGFNKYMAFLGLDQTPPPQEGQQSQPTGPAQTPPTGSGAPVTPPQPGNAMADIQTLLSGQMPNPTGVDENYVNQLGQFIHSPQFTQLQPQQKQMVVQYIQMLQQHANQAPPAATPGATPMPQGAPNGNA